MTPRPGHPHITFCGRAWKILYVKGGRVRYVLAATFPLASTMAFFYRGDPK